MSIPQSSWQFWTIPKISSARLFWLHFVVLVLFGMLLQQLIMADLVPCWNMISSSMLFFRTDFDRPWNMMLHHSSQLWLVPDILQTFQSNLPEISNGPEVAETPDTCQIRAPGQKESNAKSSPRAVQKMPWTSDYFLEPPRFWQNAAGKGNRMIDAESYSNACQSLHEIEP